MDYFIAWVGRDFDGVVVGIWLCINELIFVGRSLVLMIDLSVINVVGVIVDSIFSKHMKVLCII